MNDGEWSSVSRFTSSLRSLVRKDGISLDLCMLGWHSSSLSTSSCRAGTAPWLSSSSGGWMCSGYLGFWLKAEVKKALSPSAFSSSLELVFLLQHAIKDGETPWPLFVINAFGKAFLLNFNAGGQIDF